MSGFCMHSLVVHCNLKPQVRTEDASGVGKGGRGSDDPPFLGATFIHFLHKVLGVRSVQK